MPLTITITVSIINFVIDPIGRSVAKLRTLRPIRPKYEGPSNIDYRERGSYAEVFITLGLRYYWERRYHAGVHPTDRAKGTRRMVNSSLWFFEQWTDKRQTLIEKSLASLSQRLDQQTSSLCGLETEAAFFVDTANSAIRWDVVGCGWEGVCNRWVFVDRLRQWVGLVSVHIGR